MKQEIFSKRIGIRPVTADIVVRNDAPIELRRFLHLIMKEYMRSLKKIRDVVCKTINEAPDPNNWRENDFMDSEIQCLLDSCKWYRIYDIIECFYTELDQRTRTAFENKINEFFYEKGIGWKVEKGTIVSRGDDFFEEALNKGIETLTEKNC